MLAIRPEDVHGPRAALPERKPQRETNTMATPAATANRTVTKQSGIGASAGVVSELSLFWKVKPGH